MCGLGAFTFNIQGHIFLRASQRMLLRIRSWVSTLWKNWLEIVVYRCCLPAQLPRCWILGFVFFFVHSFVIRPLRWCAYLTIRLRFTNPKWNSRWLKVDYLSAARQSLHLREFKRAQSAVITSWQVYFPTNMLVFATILARFSSAPPHIPQYIFVT